jgi:hypothetical protein
VGWFAGDRVSTSKERPCSDPFTTSGDYPLNYQEEAFSSQDIHRQFPSYGKRYIGRRYFIRQKPDGCTTNPPSAEPTFSPKPKTQRHTPTPHDITQQFLAPAINPPPPAGSIPVSLLSDFGYRLRNPIPIAGVASINDPCSGFNVVRSAYWSKVIHVLAKSSEEGIGRGWNLPPMRGWRPLARSGGG